MHVDDYIFNVKVKCCRYMYVLHQQLVIVCVDIGHLKNRSTDGRSNCLSADNLLATYSRCVYCGLYTIYRQTICWRLIVGACMAGFILFIGRQSVGDL